MAKEALTDDNQEDNLTRELVLSSHYVSPKDQMPVIQLGSKHLYLLIYSLNPFSLSIGQQCQLGRLLALGMKPG